MLNKTQVACAVRLGLLPVLAVTMTPMVVADDDAVESAERIVVTGSRAQPRSVADSTVPVDLLSEEELENVPFTDTNDVLRTLVPSYSVGRQPISDGGTFIRPATLRGMPTDKTLVLVNSKRRHRSALVEIGGSGAQGPDVATIPVSALKGVEVLRDGAAAQYGSDAIAGVINFQLKDNTEGGMVSVEWGEYYEGDGQSFTLNFNKGFDLGGEGFLSISGEWSDADDSSRSEQYCESWFCLDPSNPDYDPSADYNIYLNDPDFMAAVAQAGDVVQPWGQPNSEAKRIFVNAGYDLTDTDTLYLFGNYSESEADGSFYYRYPGNGTIEDIRLQDGSLWNPLEIYPGGFTPRFFGEVFDYSIAGGIEGEVFDGWMYDLSARFGSNTIEYTLKNTINPSLGDQSPQSFRPGDLTNEEFQLQADFSQGFDVGLDGDLYLLLGMTYMDESYEVEEGDPASYAAGPYAQPDPWEFCNDDGTPTSEGSTVEGLDCADSSDPVYRVVGVGSNGFPGYSPEYASSYDRDSFGVYLDLSADVTEALFLQAAARYEDYSDFGSETVGKVAGLYRINDVIGLRSSIGTGFRAPTPGQQGTTNVSTRLPDGFPVATGLFPAGGDIAQALGAKDLEAETSVNYTAGLTATWDDLNLTLDFYRIDLEDRFYAISAMDVSTDPSSDGYANYQSLSNAGVVGAESIGGVFFFQNAFDSKTTGADLVVNYVIDSSYGDTSLTASLNYNKTEFDSDPSDFLNAEDQYDFENGQPEFKGVFTATHNIGDWALLARANVYGSYDNSDGSVDLPDGSTGVASVQEFDPLVQFDFEAKYFLNEYWNIAVGARNAFDEYPEVSEYDNCCGQVYWASSPVDWQGGFYYGKLTASF